MKRHLSLLVLIAFASILNSCSKGETKSIETNPSKTASSAMLDIIKNLEGEWQGEYEWTGARSGKGKQTARYYLTGYNSAVIEDLINEDGTVSMSSIYHMDGDNLRMTHYCAANNQPRLKAYNIEPQNRFVEFEMLDITNLKHDKAGHVDKVKLEFLDKSRLNINFTYVEDDEESLEIVRLTRVK